MNGGVLLTILAKLKSLLGFKPVEPPLISVVMQFRKPIPLPDDVLHAAMVRAWGRDVKKDLGEYATRLGAICFVKFDGMMVLLTHARKPYCPAEYLEQALNEFPELRQKKVVREHKAFLTIDLQQPKAPQGTAKNDCYRRMCRLAAELVDDNCMGIYFPEIGHLRPHDAQMKNALRSDRPLEEINKWGEAPVVLIEGDDPLLQAAVAEARRCWPDFVQAFEHRSPNQEFGVKALFEDGEHGEWMWVAVSSINGGAIHGKLGNAPVDVRGVREGDSVTIQAAEIGDWFYNDGDQLVGRFGLAPPDKP